ncbi:MAG: hypothetical protein AAFX53_17180 [Bacteroidota bacterium]
MNLSFPFFLIWSIIFISFSFGQNNLQESDYYLWFDTKITLENSGLLNGTVYTEQHIMGNEKTKFFLSRGFSPGLVIYEGQPYFDLELQYDVYSDNLLVKLPPRLGSTALKLIKRNVESFIITDYEFRNLSEYDSEGSALRGFYEVSYTSVFFVLFTKYTKSDFERKDKGTIYYEFPFRENKYFLKYNDAYHPIKNKKDLAALFPEYEQKIRAFYTNAKSMRRSDPHKFMLALMNHLDNLIFSVDKEIKG